MIQEDEYDQHMDESEENPKWDDMAGYVSGGYVWLLPTPKKEHKVSKKK